MLYFNPDQRTNVIGSNKGIHRFYCEHFLTSVENCYEGCITSVKVFSSNCFQTEVCNVY